MIVLGDESQERPNHDNGSDDNCTEHFQKFHFAPFSNGCTAIYHADDIQLAIVAHAETEKANYRFLTPLLRVLRAFMASLCLPFQLPVFDASVLDRFCFLFSKFCLLFSRRQNPVVQFVSAAAKMEASESGSWRGNAGWFWWTRGG